RGNKEHTLKNNRILKSMHYTHSWVNHSLNFVDPITGTHRNAFEGLWETRTKRHIKRMRGMSNDKVDSYLGEYMWRSGFFPPKASIQQYMGSLVATIIRNEKLKSSMPHFQL
ncbi:hypothetical protein L917_20442, partial [Phytophthora nicotianae]